MLRLVITTLGLLCAISAIAQNPINWTSLITSNYELKVHSIDDTPTGAVLALEVLSGPFGHTDIAIVYVNDEGEIQSSFVLGSSNPESGRNIIVRHLQNTDVLVSGYWENYPNTARRAFIARFTNAGDLVWSYTPLEPLYHDSPRDVIEQPDGSILWCGSTITNSFGGTDGFVVKFSEDGEVQWAFHLGGEEDEHFYSIKTSNGLIYIAGNSKSYSGIHHGLVVKLNQDGEVIDQLIVQNSELELFFGCEVDNEGNVYLGGYTKSLGQPANDIWLCKIDTNNNLQWNFAYPGTYNDSCTDLVLFNNTLTIIANSASFIGGESAVLVQQIDKTTSLQLSSHIYSLQGENSVEDVTGVATISEENLFICSIEEIGGNEFSYLTKRPIETLSNDCYFSDFSPERTNLDGDVIMTSYPTGPFAELIWFELQSSPIDITSEVQCEVECDDEVILNYSIGNCPNSPTSLSIDNDFSTNTWSFQGDSLSNTTFFEISTEDTMNVSLQFTQGICSYDTTIVVISSFPEELIDEYLEIGSCDNSILISDSAINQDFTFTTPSMPIFVESDTTLNLLIGNSCWTSSIILDVDLFEYEMDYIVIQDSECEPANLMFELEGQNIDIIVNGDTFLVDSVLAFTETMNISILDTITGCQNNQSLAPPPFDPSLCIECEQSIFVPNVFSPNSDGINDRFRPIIGCISKNYSLKIYNRWGDIVFTSQSEEESWNGSYMNGNHFVPDGVYSWILLVDSVRLSGHVTILR